MKTNEALPHNYKMVISVLGYGKAKAITNERIGQITGIKDKRYIHDIMANLINKYGYAIGSSRSGTYKGYYLIESETELNETLHSFSNHINSMNKRRKNLRLNYSENSDNIIKRG